MFQGFVVAVIKTATDMLDYLMLYYQMLYYQMSYCLMLYYLKTNKFLTLLQSERPKFCRVLAVLSAVGLNAISSTLRPVRSGEFFVGFHKIIHV